jgi:hypothetical protein
MSDMTYHEKSLQTMASLPKDAHRDTIPMMLRRYGKALDLGDVG